MDGTLDSPSAISVNALVFSGGEIWNEDEPSNTILQSLAQSVSGPSNESCQSDREQGVSTYVRVFEDMVTTVIKEETHLLNDEEFALLTVFAHLSYNARFLMVKLLLRKQEAWHRLEALKYEGELGSVSAIVDAINELCQAGNGPSDVVKVETSEEQGIVDYTTDKCVANPQQEQNEPGLAEVDSSPLALAKCETEMDLESLLECLKVEELKLIAKELKLKIKNRKDDLIKDLLSTSSSQSTLTFFTFKDGVTQPKGRVYHQTTLSFGKLGSQQDRLRAIVLRHIVKCVRVNKEFFGVVHRVNLVYFRITQYTPNILVAALLTRFGKRAYPGYKYERTRNIWPSRQALLDYEEVLILEGQVDALLAGNVSLFSGRATGSKTPAPRCLPTPATSGSVNSNRGNGEQGDEDTTLDVILDNGRTRGARIVKDILEWVYPRWQDLVVTKSEEDGRTNGLERFHYGHVLTRIICKGSAALGILREYERELDVLEALLSQKRWHRGQRGRWHNRRVLILSTHLGKDMETIERTLDAVMEALKDPDTRIVHRPKLQRRLRKLENKLKIPAKERHTCDGTLADADEITFEAIRLKHRAASLRLDRAGRLLEADPSSTNHGIKRYYSPVTTPVKTEHSPSTILPARSKLTLNTLKGRSLWLGKNGEELTVENLALQRYEEQGFKGVHSETRVISMLFSLLFWDIIFESIPGAFETPYQTAPLDIAEDSFYHSRKDLMEKRLVAIEAGKGIDLIRAVDVKHRTSETWCVGVRWDLFTSEDLVNIVTCIGGKALAVICRVLCEDYTFGTSGGPDLFLWDAEKGTCKFAEVKGPGDSLQENQRIWIDILLKAPVSVEICRVVEHGNENEKKPNVRTPKSTRKKGKKSRQKEEEMEVESDDADALPTTHIVLDEQRAPPTGHVDAHFATSMNPASLKRKAVQGESPTPPKRQRTS